MHDDYLVIRGLKRGAGLRGDIPVRGAKNAALKAFAASLLFRDALSVKNVPEIEDVSRMAGLLRALGVFTEKRRSTFTFFVPRGAVNNFPRDEAKRFRASVVATGPSLARFGKVAFPHPGGCLIGSRPIDVFLRGFSAMGARIKTRGDNYYIEAPDGILRGARIFFPLQSVTGTETLMMAAVLARGKTTLENAALEPEVEELARFLNMCGARIEGAGTPTITVVGTPLLRARGRAYITPPDRIETGSFLILGALLGRDVRITRTRPSHVTAAIGLLESVGVPVEIAKDTIRVRRPRGRIRAFNVKTHEYPGFPTDLQAPMAVLLSQAEGEALVFETIFEGRFRYVDELVRMGANIHMSDPHRIIIRGPARLSGKELQSPDLRAGLAYIIAALVADGTSVIHNVHNIDRGYERVEERLKSVGAQIERISNSPNSPNF